MTEKCKTGSLKIKVYKPHVGISCFLYHKNMNANKRPFESLKNNHSVWCYSCCSGLIFLTDSYRFTSFRTKHSSCFWLISLFTAALCIPQKIRHTFGQKECEDKWASYRRSLSRQCCRMVPLSLSNLSFSFISSFCVWLCSGWTRGSTASQHGLPSLLIFSQAVFSAHFSTNRTLITRNRTACRSCPR